MRNSNRERTKELKSTKWNRIVSHFHLIENKEGRANPGSSNMRKTQIPSAP